MGAPRFKRVELFQSVFDTLITTDATTVGSGDGFDVTGFAAGHYLMQVLQEGGQYVRSKYRT